MHCCNFVRRGFLRLAAFQGAVLLGLAGWVAGAEGGPRVAAGAESPQAQYELGVAFQDGRGRPRDVAAAAEWYRKAAIQDHPGAQVALARLYYAGLGVAFDPLEALSWLRKALKRENLDALALLGRFHEDGYAVQRDVPLAEELYRRAAEGGSPRGQYYLANHEQYCRGDLSAAFDWYRKSADQGFYPSFRELGAFYARGPSQGEREEALQWYRKGAEAGDADAQWLLARFLKERDLGGAERRKWLSACAAAGKADCAGELRDEYVRVDPNREEAEKWGAQWDRLRFEEARARANTGDKVSLARTFVREGKASLAAPLFLNAAELGNSDAMVQAAKLYDAGLGGFERNPEEAVRWYAGALPAFPREGDTRREIVERLLEMAARGDAVAQERLSHFQEKGDCDLPGGREEGLHLLRLAARQKNPAAMLRLAQKLSDSAQGSSREESEAEALFRELVATGDARQRWEAFHYVKRYDRKARDREMAAVRADGKELYSLAAKHGRQEFENVREELSLLRSAAASGSLEAMRLWADFLESMPLPDAPVKAALWRLRALASLRSPQWQKRNGKRQLYAASFENAAPSTTEEQQWAFYAAEDPEYRSLLSTLSGKKEGFLPALLDALGYDEALKNPSEAEAALEAFLKDTGSHYSAEDEGKVLQHMASFFPDPEGPSTLAAARAAALEKKAVLGDAGAAGALGRLYERGRGLEPDFIKAAGYYSSAARQGNAEAMLGYATLLELGLGVARDVGEAARWHREASAAGNRTSTARLADLLARGALGAPDCIGALAMATEAAEAGNARGRGVLGAFHADGVCVERNADRAAELLAAAAEQSDPEAMLKLALGGRPPRTGWTSMRLLARAAQIFGDGGCLLVARTCEARSKEKFDLACAYAAFSRAAALGSPEAQGGLAFHSLFPLEDFSEMAPYGALPFEQAIRMAQTAADRGDPRGKLLVGYVNLGVLGDQDCGKALPPIREAAQQGQPLAALMLAQMYKGGVCVEVDKGEWQRWLARVPRNAGPLEEARHMQVAVPIERLSRRDARPGDGRKDERTGPPVHR